MKSSKFVEQTQAFIIVSMRLDKLLKAVSEIPSIVLVGTCSLEYRHCSWLIKLLDKIDICLKIKLLFRQVISRFPIPVGHDTEDDIDCDRYYCNSYRDDCNDVFCSKGNCWHVT